VVSGFLCFASLCHVSLTVRVAGVGCASWFAFVWPMVGVSSWCFCTLMQFDFVLLCIVAGAGSVCLFVVVVFVGVDFVIGWVFVCG